MFLKRVTLSGFKSFADKVDFDFGPGVACIVGPNGCGKSNLVDAFKWVLGEQSARSLRGRQMADMIFNGSSSRRSSSVAQVDLVFDNADRTVPFDQDEVTVTRKLYRSGESEYLLNRHVARLKDVRELFMDTGIGADAYSVIEQGKVDNLLQSSPADRRIIFEEAAGISKYKARRRETERRLERTEQNLLRVADIIDELERRLRSVKLQAGKARRFKEYEARLNELRSTYAMAEYHRLTQSCEHLDREVAGHSDRATALRTQIDQKEADQAEVTLKIDGLVARVSSTDNQLVQARSDLAAQEERIEGARNRVQEQQGLMDRANERLEADTRRHEGTREDLARVQESAEVLQQQTLDFHRLIDELNEQDRSKAREFTQAQAILEDEKAGIIDLLRRNAQTHNEIIRLNKERESLLGQKGRLSARDSQIASELEATLEHRAQLRRRLAEVETLIAEETERLTQKRADAVRLDEMRQRLVDELASLKERRSALQSRRELLEDLQRNMEGVGAGVRQLLSEKEESARAGENQRAGVLDAIVGLVADNFDADVEHACIVEALLGQQDQCLVVSDSRAFLADPGRFVELPGRLTAICLDRLPPLLNECDFSDRAGFVARAVDLVRFPEGMERLATHLFGKTTVVEDLEAALAIAETDVTGHRFVTVRGEVLEPDGRISLGPAGSGAGLISRKSELRDIEEQTRAIAKQVETLSDQLNRTQAEVGHLDGVQQELRTAIYESNTAKVEARAALQNISETIERLTSEQPLIAREVALIEQQIDEVFTRSAEGGRSLEVLERENKEREEKVAAHQERIDEIFTVRRKAQEQLTETKVAAGKLAEKRVAAAEKINTLRRSMRELETSVSAAEHDIEQCHVRMEDAIQAIAAGEDRLTVLNATACELDARATSLRRERDELRFDQETRAQGVKTTRAELGGVESELHEAEMALRETHVRRDDLVVRIAEELDIDLAARYEDYEHEEQDREAVEAEIAELRTKMGRLGNVNLDAIHELDELSERHGFLTSQRDDLTTSRRQLEGLIERLNAECRERFRASFEQIRENFRALFRKLFGGGRADIILEDPENSLECGIEIVAQPPGKELQVISLMSGGEKSMTAISLLMSIFKSRPAPCAILDEVDAALDEANNERFDRIVQEFVGDTQFIIITHSKRTMNIADHLYGITMQEPGVSTRVSVQLTDANVA